MTSQIPPDGRLDGPVHEWFGLSYSNYAVLHRSLMQSMPLDWQERIVGLLREFSQAFGHVDTADCYEVIAAIEQVYSDLTDGERKALGVTCSEDDPDYPKECDTVYWDAEGNERCPSDRILVPRLGGDPVPHYNRGRTYIAPLPADADARWCLCLPIAAGVNGEDADLDIDPACRIHGVDAVDGQAAASIQEAYARLQHALDVEPFVDAIDEAIRRLANTQPTGEPHAAVDEPRPASQPSATSMQGQQP